MARAVFFDITEAEHQQPLVPWLGEDVCSGVQVATSLGKAGALSALERENDSSLTATASGAPSSAASGAPLLFATSSKKATVSLQRWWQPT